MKIQTQKFSTGVSVQVLLFGRYFSVLLHRVRFPYVSFSFLSERVTYILAVAVCFVFWAFVAIGSVFTGAYVGNLLECLLDSYCNK